MNDHQVASRRETFSPKSPKEEISDTNFEWADYLKETGSEGAPVSYFMQAIQPPVFGAFVFTNVTSQGLPTF